MNFYSLLSLSRACVGARDPYCGWDLLLKKCTTLEESVRMSQWEQSITKCPVSFIEMFPDLYITHCAALAFFSVPTLKLKIRVENIIIITQPLRTLFSPHEFNTHIHLCSYPLKTTACSVFSPCTHSLQATAPNARLRNISLPKKGILGLNNLTIRERLVPREWSRALPQSFISDCLFISKTARPFISTCTKFGSSIRGAVNLSISACLCFFSVSQTSFSSQSQQRVLCLHTLLCDFMFRRIFGTQATEHPVASVSRAVAETWLMLPAHMHSDMHICTCIYLHKLAFLPSQYCSSTFSCYAGGKFATAIQSISVVIMLSQPGPGQLSCNALFR